MKKVELLPVLFEGRQFKADNNIAVTTDGKIIKLADKPVQGKYR